MMTRTISNASRRIVRPDELDLESPGRRDYWVALEHDHDWADHLIPLTVWVGREAKPGEGMVVSGANHGNEYEGPIALKNLLQQIDLEHVRGRIILVPVLNPAAFASGTRASMEHDRVNLNRAFVEGAGVDPALAGITHRIAAFWRQCIWPSVHIAIDIHSGGLVTTIASCVSFHQSVDARHAARIEAAARWFGTPYLVTYQDTTPGLLPSEGERLGKIMLGTELGFGESVDVIGIRRAMHGVQAVAVEHGLLEGDVTPIDHHAAGNQQRVSIADRRGVSIATRSGIFEPAELLGTSVAAGDVIGYLHDFQRIDDPPDAIRAGLDGIFFACAFRAPVRQGQHIAITASPRD